MLRTAASVCVVILLFLCTGARAESPASLAIDVARASVRGPSVFVMPNRGARTVANAGEREFLVGGVVSNAQGRWYEIIYPVRGWMRESDVTFTGPSGAYNPGRFTEEQRILMRLLSDVGITPGIWKERLGMPWAEDTVQDGADGASVHTAVWPGVAISFRETAGKQLPPDAERARIVKAVVCGRPPVGFGPYALGADGAIVRRLDRDFTPGPYAEMTKGHFRAVLDEDGAVDYLAYAEDGKGFLVCPKLDAPDPEEPFYAASLYPEKWCGTKVLRAGLALEGTYEGFGCDEGCAAEIRLDSGTDRDLFAEQQEADNWLGTREGIRVRAVYNVEQKWNPDRHFCEQSLRLQGGRVIGGASPLPQSKEQCRRLVVGSGEAQGVITRVGPGVKGRGGATEDWEILLDSEKAMSFSAGPHFPGAGVKLSEGQRIGVQFERVRDWDSDAGDCGLDTYVNAPAKVLSGR